jgi:hypothetical protein
MTISPFVRERIFSTYTVAKTVPKMEKKKEREENKKAPLLVKEERPSQKPI